MACNPVQLTSRVLEAKDKNEHYLVCFIMSICASFGTCMCSHKTNHVIANFIFKMILEEFVLRLVFITTCLFHEETYNYLSF